MFDIKNLRSKLGLTQNELSSATGIERAKIASWEINRASPKADDFIILVNFCTKNGIKVEGLDMPDLDGQIIQKAKDAYLNIKEAEKALTIAQEQLAKANKEFFELDVFNLMASQTEASEAFYEISQKPPFAKKVESSGKKGDPQKHKDKPG